MNHTANDFTLMGDCSVHGKTEYLTPDRNGDSFCKKCKESWIEKFGKKFGDSPPMIHTETWMTKKL